MMEKSIRDFPRQCAFEPVVENADKLGSSIHAAVLGMGGSGLPAEMYAYLRTDTYVRVHKDYGLPPLSHEAPARTLIVAMSYSGNTEEVLDGFEQARAKGLRLVAIAVGGALLERARAYGIPYIQLPDTGIQPRMALCFSLRALARIMNDASLLKELGELPALLDMPAYEARGRALAADLNGKVPVVYASRANCAIAYNWKIKFNETGKIPAFYNVFPELNHNEMTGFDAQDATRALSAPFHFIFLHDEADHPRVQKRMALCARLYAERGLPVTDISLQGNTRSHTLFSALLTADWTALALAEAYGVEPEQVPIVETFKRLMK